MFDKLFGIDDLEKDINKFKIDIEKAKTSYSDEYAEYLEIATNFDNTVEKYDFLHKQIGALEKVYPEDTSGKSALTDASGWLNLSASTLDSVALGAWLAKKIYQWRLTKVLEKIDDVENVLSQLARAGKAANKLEDISQLQKVTKLAKASKLAKGTKIALAARFAKVVGVIGVILTLVSIAVDIAEADKRRDYLRNHKSELERHLNELNGYITETNKDTKNVIDAFLSYFDEFDIDTNGVFNSNKDGLQDKAVFDKAVSNIRIALNQNIESMGEVNSKIARADRLIKALIDGDTKDPIAKLLLKAEGEEVRHGKKLIDSVVENVELSQDQVQRLYVIELQSRSAPIEKAIEESGLSPDLVRQIYARRYLENGKTIEETVELSKLTENQVRRIYASKLLDDRLKQSKSDEVLDLEPIAVKAGLSVDVVREIRIQKLKA